MLTMSCEVQLVFGEQLTTLAEGFRERVRRTPLVINLEAT
jgi:hypothetical protein